MPKIFLIIIILLCASGCGNEFVEINLPVSVENERAAEIPEKITTDIYFDATVSMQGYTTLSGGNVYRTLPDILSDIGGSMGDINFYSFGEKITPLEGKDYRRFNSPEPYTEIITAVHNVIDKSEPAHLSIIITDLFESDADWSGIAQKIRDKFFANHLAVGVIGVKNSFYGDIFDVGLNAAKFRYDSNILPEKFRPFYLLIMGNETAVENFMQKFKARQTLPNDTEYLLLSENLTARAADLTLLEMENFYVEDRLNLEERGIREFGLDKFSAPASFTVQFDYNAPIGACPLNLAEMNYDTKIFYLDEDWRSPARNDVKISMIDDTVKIALTPEKSLSEGKINFVQVSIAPNAKGYQLPHWVNDWNMANVDAAPENFDGSKTVNLVYILGSLKDSVFAATQPVLFKMNFVVDAR